MYILVKSRQEQEVFKHLYLEISQKYDFKYNEVKDQEQRFLLLKHSIRQSEYQTLDNYLNALHQNAIGTVEINPFNPTKHSIVQAYSKTELSNHPNIVGREKETFEVGKLCIQDDYQKRGYFRNLLLVVLDHSERENAHQYLASMVMPLFQLFNKQFGEALQQIGPPDDEAIQGVPVLINADRMKRHPGVVRLQHRYSQVTTS